MPTQHQSPDLDDEDAASTDLSYLLRVGEPTLVAGERICWRMPIELALPSYGSVGQVGAVDVDVENGRILLTAELQCQARHAAKPPPCHWSLRWLDTAAMLASPATADSADEEAGVEVTCQIELPHLPTNTAGSGANTR
jgi:hypothetical protein